MLSKARDGKLEALEQEFLGLKERLATDRNHFATLEATIQELTQTITLMASQWGGPYKGNMTPVDQFS